MRGNPKVLVWTSTNRCNLGCKFCFGREGREEFGTNEAKGMISELKGLGVRHLVFSGGEPLMRKDIFILAAFARRRGLRTILHTNGILVNKKNADKIAKLFDVVNVPIDGADEKANARMGRGKLGHTLEVIGLLAGKTGITVSTVATRANISEIPKIGALLETVRAKHGTRHGKLKWRVFRFEPRLGAAQRNRRLFEIGGREFAALKRKAKGALFVSPGGEFDRSYRLVASDGELQQ